MNPVIHGGEPTHIRNVNHNCQPQYRGSGKPEHRGDGGNTGLWGPTGRRRESVTSVLVVDTKSSSPRSSNENNCQWDQKDYQRDQNNCLSPTSSHSPHSPHTQKSPKSPISPLSPRSPRSLHSQRSLISPRSPRFCKSVLCVERRPPSLSEDIAVYNEPSSMVKTGNMAAEKQYAKISSTKQSEDVSSLCLQFEEYERLDFPSNGDKKRPSNPHRRCSSLDSPYENNNNSNNNRNNTNNNHNHNRSNSSNNENSRNNNNNINNDSNNNNKNNSIKNNNINRSYLSDEGVSRREKMSVSKRLSGSVDSLYPPRGRGMGGGGGGARDGGRMLAGYSYLSLHTLPQDHEVVRNMSWERRAKELRLELENIRKERRRVREELKDLEIKEAQFMMEGTAQFKNKEVEDEFKNKDMEDDFKSKDMEGDFKSKDMEGDSKSKEMEDEGHLKSAEVEGAGRELYGCVWQEFV